MGRGLEGRRARARRWVAGTGVTLTVCVLGVACSGGVQDEPGGPSGSGGSPGGSGGAISGGGGIGGNATGTGGGGASGGAGGTLWTGGGAATGGSSSGAGGSDTASDGWDEVRCFHFGETETGAICFGRIGNLWTAVFPMCVIESQTRYPMDLNATCLGQDDPAGWDETWCSSMQQCNGRRGTWRTEVDVECHLPSEIPVVGTPSELRCEGAAAESPTGWDNVQCFPANGGAFAECFGSLGLYYPTWGLLPTCYIDANYANSADFTEVPPGPEIFCP